MRNSKLMLAALAVSMAATRAELEGEADDAKDEVDGDAEPEWEHVKDTRTRQQRRADKRREEKILTLDRPTLDPFGDLNLRHDRDTRAAPRDDNGDRISRFQKR